MTRWAAQGDGRAQSARGNLPDQQRPDSGRRGRESPLPVYISHGVPVALATDDQGVSRSDMTHEYLRAVETYKLSYPQLKRMSRQSLEHSFLPGASLWLGDFRRVAACAADPTKATRFLPGAEVSRRQRTRPHAVHLERSLGSLKKSLKNLSSQLLFLSGSWLTARSFSRLGMLDCSSGEVSP